MINLLITGGSGYVGTRLTNYLLDRHKTIKIVNYDISFYGDDHLPINRDNYFYEKHDIRNAKKLAEVIKTQKIDIVLHLACISNDPSFELNSKISKVINFDCFEDIVKFSKANGVKKFIYASTSSVYGVSDSPNVDENHLLKPITDYNTYKAKCEPVLKKYLDNSFHGIIIRPATVCGFSEKMRFDLSVNILTNYAYVKNIINVFGGEQYRPNINIIDMCRLYEKIILEDIIKFNGEIFNAGVENLQIKNIAEIVKKVVDKKFNKDIKIIKSPSDDIRSYRINSEKIQNIFGFEFKYSVEDAVLELCNNFENGHLQDTFNDRFQNIKVLRKLEAI
jgi:nucleoside-diphosphate-sugar epimerase